MNKNYDIFSHSELFALRNAWRKQNLKIEFLILEIKFTLLFLNMDSDYNHELNYADLVTFTL